MPTAISLITLLTDFGEQDYFVASMKGVMLNINPQVRIVDLSHRVAPYHIEDAGYLLKSSYHYFPVGTIHGRMFSTLDTRLKMPDKYFQLPTWLQIGRAHV